MELRMFKRMMKGLIFFLLVLMAMQTNLYARGGGHSHGGGHHSSYKSKSYKSSGDVHVRGYYRKNGTYVQPHYRSHPNGTQRDNWSTKGNVNPHTGKIGTKEPKY
jgi:hypothetical protein